MRSWWTYSTLGLAFALVSCGVPPSAGTGTTETTSATDVISVGDLDVIVPPDAEGRYPDDLVVACDGTLFPIGALETIRPLAEAGDEGLATAIEPFLASGEGEFWPQEGWQLLHSDQENAQLVAKTGDGTLAFMHLSHDGSRWSWSGSSMAGDECGLRFVVPDGLNTVEWRLDPTGPELTEESTSIAVILNERECVGGIEIGDRLVGPQVVMTETQVFVAFAAEPPPGEAFTCQGNPDTPHRIDLPEPLGNRDLVEGLEIGINLEDYVD